MFGRALKERQQASRHAVVFVSLCQRDRTEEGTVRKDGPGGEGVGREEKEPGAGNGSWVPR